LERYAEAAEYYNQALAYFDQKKDLRGYWHSQYSIAHLAQCRQNYVEAIAIYEKAVDAFAKSEDLSYLSDTYLNLSKIYRATGKPDKALDYYIKYSEIKSKISSGEVLSQMAQLEMQYDLEKMEQKNKLDIALINKEKQIITYRYYIISGLLLIGVLVLITLMYRRNTKKKLIEAKLINAELEQKNLEEEIKYSKKELESFALQIVHTNDFLLSIKKSLHDIKDSKDGDVISQKVREISFQITQSLRRNKDIEKLQERIDLVHSSFMKKLSEQFPQLTEKEKRLCVMLKLDLSSKEIAVLNNISENAVMMARYRMRKKMNMNSEENLVDFLQKIR
jgi:DNA-binding CsgD family transcriptional regulator/tetratricopeptide (TPR) repeat protein